MIQEMKTCFEVVAEYLDSVDEAYDDEQARDTAAYLRDMTEDDDEV